MAMTPEGLASLKEQGLANSEDTVQSFSERLTKMEEKSKEISTLTDHVNLMYGGEVVKTEDGKTIKKYTQDILDKMVYATSKIADYDTRIPSVSQGPLSKGIDVKSVIDGVLNNDSSALVEAVETQAFSAVPVTVYSVVTVGLAIGSEIITSSSSPS